MNRKVNPQKTYQWFVNAYEVIGYKSLNQFAAKNGLQKSTLSRYFHCQRQIPSDTLVKLSRTLKVEPNEILKAIGAL